MMENIREKIVLAALLHDIGKFWQRADESFDDKENELSEQSKALAGYICPLNEHHRFGYQHVIWTNEFLEKYIPKSFGFHQNVFDKENLDDDNLFNLSVFHHKPNSELQGLITLADWWSSGIDRRKESTLENEEEQNDRNINWGRKRYKTRPLNSIFNTVNEGKGKGAFQLHPLGLNNESIFPKEIKKKEDGISQEEYTALWNSFIEEYKQLPYNSIGAFIESLIFLLKKYAWCIPASTNDMANVSLYEHLKTTAAIADCLFVYRNTNPNSFNWNGSTLRIKTGDFPVLLMGVDISGIQKFIYNISRRQAAKSLKGRSFYLQLLVDSIIRQIIKGCGVTQAHVLYSSGGNFYMLLPNTKEVKKELTRIRLEAEEELWHQHNGSLSINMDWVPFAYHQNKENKISTEGQDSIELGKLWKKLADKIAVQKQQKFKSLLTNGIKKGKEEIQSLFTVKEDGGAVKTCSVSGIELNEKEIKLIDNKIDLPVTKIVYQQTEIGSTLKDADYLIEYKGRDESAYLNRRAHSQIRVLKTDFYLFDQSEIIKEEAEFRNSITSADVSLIKQFNQPDKFLLAQLKGQAVSYGFQFYGGNKQALKKEEKLATAKTFEELAISEKGETTYLGVLRMDIDGLGNIFIKGLSEKDKSFAAFATLSFLLDTFFSGYLNTIRGNNAFQMDGKAYNFRDWVNILYSGGDDVFAVGRWEEIIAFAEAIRREFNRFTLRDDITISGGISIVRQKFPISKAAQMAGEAEYTSKNFAINSNNSEEDNEKEPEKNAITFLGETVSWENEFSEVKRLKNEFIVLARRTNSRGFLHQIMRFRALRNKRDLSYLWNAAYYFKRFSEQHGKKAGVQVRKNLWEIPEIESLKNKLFSGHGRTSNLRYFDLAVLAARWAEMELKFNSQNK